MISGKLFRQEIATSRKPESSTSPVSVDRPQAAGPSSRASLESAFSGRPEVAAQLARLAAAGALAVSMLFANAPSVPAQEKAASKPVEQAAAPAVDAEKARENLKKGETEYARRSEVLKSLSESQVDDITFVRNIYTILLNRNVTDREMTGWVGRLKSGSSRIAIIESITSSDEYYVRHEVTGSVSATRARLMQKPGMDSVCVANLSKGTAFKVSSQSGEWYYARLANGQSGYLNEGGVAIDIPIFGQYGGAAKADAPADTAEAGLSRYARVFRREIEKLRDIHSQLDACLLKNNKYNFYEIKPGKLVEGEKLLARFRALTQDLADKAAVMNLKNPVKFRVGKLRIDNASLISYDYLKSLVSMQAANLDAAAVDVLRGGKSLIPNKYFPMADEKNSRIILEALKEETGYRHMRRFAVVDLLDLGAELFAKRRELFMKNAFGEFSVSAEPGRHFADFLNPAAQEIMFGYLDAVVASGYFDAIVIDNLRFPAHAKSNNDIRTVFAYNDSIVREFEKNTGLSIATLNEQQEEIYKKFVSTKLEKFVSDLRRYFSSKKQPFYAVVDGEYYSRKFDTRICEYRVWGNNADALFIRFSSGAKGEAVEASLTETAKSVTKPVVITVSPEDPSIYLDIVGTINENAPVVKGLYSEK